MLTKRLAADWKDYEQRFMGLLAERKIDERVSPDLLRGGCLLCSEHLPHKCHRRLVAEYLCEKWGGAVKSPIWCDSFGWNAQPPRGATELKVSCAVP